MKSFFFRVKKVSQSTAKHTTYCPTSTVFFNNYLFFKFINKWQNEILRCAPPSSHVCDFFLICNFN